MRTDAGFSAVELLITLFIAAVFLVAGHQLYTAVMQNSGEAQQTARASNIAYRYLRKKVATITTGTCSANSITEDVPAAESEGLANVKVTTSTTCPALPVTLTKITATVTYGSDGKVVTHAIYSNGK